MARDARGCVAAAPPGGESRRQWRPPLAAGLEPNVTEAQGCHAMPSRLWPGSSQEMVERCQTDPLPPLGYGRGRGQGVSVCGSNKATPPALPCASWELEASFRRGQVCNRHQGSSVGENPTVPGGGETRPHLAVGLASSSPTFHFINSIQILGLAWRHPPTDQ